MTAKTGIARLKITLDDVKPPVVRRIEVPLGIRLDRLHAALQVAIGWTNSHLWEFRAGGSGWGVPDPDGGFGDEPHDAKKATLFGVLEDTDARSIVSGGLRLRHVSLDGSRVRQRRFASPAMTSSMATIR